MWVSKSAVAKGLISEVNLCSSIKVHEITSAEDVPYTNPTDCK